MAKYAVALLRERLAEALDRVDQGEAVVIQRRDVTYRIVAEKRKRRRAAKRPRIDILDQAVETGHWIWEWDGGNLAFRGSGGNR